MTNCIVFILSILPALFVTAVSTGRIKKVFDFDRGAVHLVRCIRSLSIVWRHALYDHDYRIIGPQRTSTQSRVQRWTIGEAEMTNGVFDLLSITHGTRLYAMGR
jgi:hypothetical protein